MTTTKRFQVYRRRALGGALVHITSIKAESLAQAIDIEMNQCLGLNNDRVAFLKNYRIVGITLDTDENIYNNLPNHSTRRMRNGGKRVRFRGSLYTNQPAKKRKR